jgi:hypothetical protein
VPASSGLLPSAPTALDLPNQGLVPPCALRYLLARRLQVEHFAQDTLVGSKVTRPCSVVVLELHAVADRGEGEL